MAGHEITSSIILFIMSFGYALLQYSSYTLMKYCRMDSFTIFEAACLSDSPSLT